MHYNGLLIEFQVTALALMIGHRISIDIDLFTDQEFDALEVSQYLKSTYDTDLNSVSIMLIKEKLKWKDIEGHIKKQLLPVRSRCKAGL